MAEIKPLKPKSCKNPKCGMKFRPWNSLQIACSGKCALEVAKRKAEAKHRKAMTEAKEKIKTKAEHLQDAQKAFNEYIRLRDANEPCISCQRHHKGQYHAGHYRTVGAHPELRFSEENCHRQCSVCNNHRSGNIVEYRINLKAKIGDDRLEQLEGPHDAANYTIDDIKEIKTKYRAKCRELKKA